MTLGAFVYNVCADLVGGIEVTLSDKSDALAPRNDPSRGVSRLEAHSRAVTLLLASGAIAHRLERRADNSEVDGSIHLAHFRITHVRYPDLLKKL